MTHNEEIRIDPELTQMLELAVKVIKKIVITVYFYVQKVK